MSQRSGLLLIILAAFGLFGCAQTAKLRGSVATVRKQLEQIERNGAYTCAPKELALAKAHLLFAESEIQQGHGRRAQQHYEIAAANAKLADEKSPPDKCAGPDVVVTACIDPDSDRICADADRCPDAPEDWNGIDDRDGCPDDLDNDGIVDKADQCPIDAEDKDGYLDNDGCPDLDNDFDGVPDATDKCPNDPEDPDGFKDEDGCPDPDNDKDGIADVDDQCPNQAGKIEDKGCPKKYAGVEITRTHLRINQTIYFEYNKATIKKTSFWILDQVALVLKDNPEITISVEGHTDAQGNDAYNMKLSNARAKSVMDYLIKKGGVSKTRLTSKGFGETRPIDSNLTEEGRAVNRRVEFVRTDVPRED